jgi:hypothetical protein
VRVHTIIAIASAAFFVAFYGGIGFLCFMSMIAIEDPLE